ncbi:hypothetical protein M405DRAFT_844338 [Rhizopogon salebrosus TDB-379]|nr:hypothetical protein M405DRAFT_844338 [Rhizopogon salebrosus TDB-379]
MSLGAAAVPVKLKTDARPDYHWDSYGSSYILFTSIVTLCSSGVESADPPQQPAVLVKLNETAVALRRTSSAWKSNRSAPSLPFHFALAATQNHADRPCYTHNVLAKFPLYSASTSRSKAGLSPDFKLCRAFSLPAQRRGSVSGLIDIDDAGVLDGTKRYDLVGATPGTTYA